MPNGSTHDIITVVVAPVVAGVSYWATKDIKTTAIIFIAYLFASLMFNGDLDTNSRPYNRWFILKMIWIPYQLLFEHRSVFTHGLIIGTLIRVVYVAIIPLAVFAFRGDTPHILTAVNLKIFLYVLIGLEAGSAVHTISDKIF
jgi:uncharacterized metal-binding protein